MAQEAAIAAKTSTYEHGVLETETRLTAEVTAVYREYCAETYNQALNRAGILANSNLRKMDQVYYLEDLREHPTPPPPPANLPLPPHNEPLPAQKPPQDTEVSIRAEKEKNGVAVASQKEEKAKEKEKEKKKEQNKADANPSEDALTVGDMVFKAKVAGSKSKIDSKKDYHQS